MALFILLDCLLRWRLTVLVTSFCCLVKLVVMSFSIYTNQVLFPLCKVCPVKSWYVWTTSLTRTRGQKTGEAITKTKHPNCFNLMFDLVCWVSLPIECLNLHSQRNAAQRTKCQQFLNVCLCCHLILFEEEKPIQRKNKLHPQTPVQTAAFTDWLLDFCKLLHSGRTGFLDFQWLTSFKFPLLEFPNFRICWNTLCAEIWQGGTNLAWRFLPTFPGQDMSHLGCSLDQQLSLLGVCHGHQTCSDKSTQRAHMAVITMPHSSCGCRQHNKLLSMPRAVCHSSRPRSLCEDISQGEIHLIPNSTMQTIACSRQKNHILLTPMNELCMSWAVWLSVSCCGDGKHTVFLWEKRSSEQAHGQLRWWEGLWARKHALFVMESACDCVGGPDELEAVADDGATAGADGPGQGHAQGPAGQVWWAGGCGWVDGGWGGRGGWVGGVGGWADGWVGLLHVLTDLLARWDGWGEQEGEGGQREGGADDGWVEGVGGWGGQGGWVEGAWREWGWWWVVGGQRGGWREVWVEGWLEWKGVVGGGRHVECARKSGEGVSVGGSEAVGPCEVLLDFNLPVMQSWVVRR